NRKAGVDQGLKLFDYLVAPELYRADFDNLVGVRVQPCRFQVNRDQDIAHGECLSSPSNGAGCCWRSLIGASRNRNGSRTGGQIDCTGCVQRQTTWQFASSAVSSTS